MCDVENLLSKGEGQEIEGFEPVNIGSAIEMTDSSSDPSLDILNHDAMFHLVTVPDDRTIL